MKLNIRKMWEVDAFRVGEALKDQGLEQIDSHAYEFNYEGGIIVYLTLSPELLFYHNVSVKEDTLTMWVKCRIECKEDLVGVTALKFKELFSVLKYRPFHDEDAYLGYFTRPKTDKDGFSEISFFLNPDYPEGAWENHTI